MSGKVLRSEVGLGLDEANSDPALGRIVAEDGAQEVRGDVTGGAIEPAVVGRPESFAQMDRNGWTSGGTNGLRMNETIGSSHSLSQEMMNDSFRRS